MSRMLVASCKSAGATTACVGAPAGIRFGEPGTLCTTFYECNSQAGNCTVDCPFGSAFNFNLQTCGAAHDHLSLATCNNHLAANSKQPPAPGQSISPMPSPPFPSFSAVPSAPDGAGDFWQTLFNAWHQVTPCSVYSSPCCGSLYNNFAIPFGETLHPLLMRSMNDRLIRMVMCMGVIDADSYLVPNLQALSMQVG